MTQPLVTLDVSVADGLPPSLPLTLERAIPSGTLLRLRASSISMLRGLAVSRVVATMARRPVELELVHRFSEDELQREWRWHIRSLSIAVLKTPVALAAGTDLEVWLDAKPGPRVAELDWLLYAGTLKSVKDVSLAQVAEPVRLHFVAGPAENLEVKLKPDGRAFATYFDQYGNPTSAHVGLRLEVRAEGAARATAVDTETGTLELPIGVDAHPGRPEGRRISVADELGRRAVSNARPLAIDGTPIYFGECHWHTDFSGDGQRSLASALRSARDELGLDFAGPADHLSPDGTYVHRLPVEQARICGKFNQPGRFCVLPGAELSGRYGHTNLYAADFDTFLSVLQRFPHELLPVWRDSADVYPLELLAALCPVGRAMVVPHHSNMDSSVVEGVVREDGRPFWCAFHWPQPTPLLRQGVRLIEIVQNRGAFETEAAAPQWRVQWGGFGGSAQTGLIRGHRVGFVGGTDNHLGWPTRLPNKRGYGGLTAVQSEELTSSAVFDALYARRCYATSGARIVADATLNEAPIGSELVLEAEDPRSMEIRIFGTAPLRAVQVISLGAVLADLPIDGASTDFVGEWFDDRPGRPLQDVYYYVRARQADGHCVWLSPWWVDLASA